MGDIKGFLKVKRKPSEYRQISERIQDFKEIPILRSEENSQEQGSRCMDCGTPFCHYGCPLANLIPEWNDLMFRGQWKKAFEVLQSTNNFPEITARVCPAQCEFACVLGINDEPVTIRENELAIIEYAFRQGLVKPHPSKKRTGKKVAIIGSGPAGLACADQLNKVGHKVIVLEKDDKIGGILRYGIPDFKLEKWIIDRRLKILEKEGIIFKPNVYVGKDYSASKINKDFDAVCLSIGSGEPRDLDIPGRDLFGIHLAMDFLKQSNRIVNGESIKPENRINAKNKRVVVIGGGDTGADCVGVAHRQGANSVMQIELLPKPSECRSEDYPWPKYPMILKTTTSHEEGGRREWSILTKKFLGENGQVKKLSCVRVGFSKKEENTCPIMKELPQTEFEIEADLVILALGFVRPIHQGLLDRLGLKYDTQGNVLTDANYITTVRGIFSAGDSHRGASLVVWAIYEGRQVAYYIDKYLMGDSSLPIL